MFLIFIVYGQLMFSAKKLPSLFDYNINVEKDNFQSNGQALVKVHKLYMFLREE